MNEERYIVPGLGDFGDRLVELLLLPWRNSGWDGGADWDV